MALSDLLGVSPAPFVAGAAISQFRAVVLDSTAGQVVAGSAITGLCIGASLVEATAAGDPMPVQTQGIAKLTASAAISLGAEVMITGSGSGKVSTASGATAVSLGIALEAATADGDIISVLLRPMVKSPANS